MWPPVLPPSVQHMYVHTVCTYIDKYVATNVYAIFTAWGQWRLETYVRTQLCIIGTDVMYTYARTVAMYVCRMWLACVCSSELHAWSQQVTQWVNSATPVTHCVLGPFVLCRYLLRQLLAAWARLCWCCSTFTSLPVIPTSVLSYL